MWTGEWQNLGDTVGTSVMTLLFYLLTCMLRYSAASIYCSDEARRAAALKASNSVWFWRGPACGLASGHVVYLVQQYGCTREKLTEMH
jgi:hypothetical protein